MSYLLKLVKKLLSNLEYVFLNGLMSVLSAFIVYYLLMKKAEKTIDYYKKELKNDAEKWLNSDSGQKAIYSIGALIGNGARTGIGLKGTSGKFKIEDLIAQIAGQWVQNKFLPQEQNTVQPIQKSSHSLNIE